MKEKDIAGTPSERRGSEPLDQRRRGRERAAPIARKDPQVGHTPGSAEGEERDVDEALRHDSE